MKSLQALFGGAFDPVCYGHLKPVEILVSPVGLSRAIIVPGSVPPHRAQSEAPGEQRQRMVELAIADKPLFSSNRRELGRDTVSYTARTLKEWRKERGPNVPLAFVVGQDSLLTFPSWYNYDTVLSNTHLIACRRPGYPLEMAQEKHQQWLGDHLIHPSDDLHNLPYRKIYLVGTPWFNIFATFIHERLEEGKPCDDFMPAVVLGYINQQGLYR